MRYAIISDIHANLQAFEAVLADMSAQNIDSVICLGDVVGYGTQPVEVLALARQHVNVMLMGNHDAAVAGLMDTSEFSDGAVMAIEATKAQLDREAISYLESLPYECNAPNFACAHADLSDPENYDYMQTPEDALRCFKARTEQLLFVGHTHEPAVFLLDPEGECMKLPFENYKLLDRCRYLINPGSVGMPRTTDLRATYCIYDTELNKVTFHRVSYDVQAFRKMIEKDAKSSEQIAYVLELLDNHMLPVRKEKKDKASIRVKKKQKPRVISVKVNDGNAASVPKTGWNISGEKKAGAAKKDSKPGKSRVGITAFVLVAAACVAGGIYALRHNGRSPGTVAGKGESQAAAPAAAVRSVAPERALVRFGALVLEHRWSFNNSLEDSVGGSKASIVDSGTKDVKLGTNQVVIGGGVREASGYVSLGSRLLGGLTDPVTIELWAAQVSAKQWGRIFDFGGGTSNSLLMTWSLGKDENKDRVEWSPNAVGSAVDNSNGPYALGKEFHIVMVIEPGVGAGGTTKVRWYSAPSDSAMLGAVRGSFYTPNTLAAMVDTSDNLGRSFYPSDETANASYNEVRIWRGVPSWTVLEKLHQGGPDAVYK